MQRTVSVPEPYDSDAQCPANVEAPLCIDLDGTLLRSDSLFECLAAAIRNPLVLLQLPLWLVRGKAYLKAKLARRVELNVATLPFHTELFKWIQKARKNGRKIVLATGADQHVANGVAAHLEIFDETIASDGTRNLTGKQKAQALCGRFGPRGFSYVGNHRSDFVVWKSALSSVVVGMNPRQASRVASVSDMEAHFPLEQSRIQSFVQLVRPHQWSKNFLVFVPIITANAITDWTGWMRCLGLFFSLSLVASALYIFNDIVDLESDRAHPNKRKRPLASGDFPLSWAFSIAAGGLLLGFVVAGLFKALPEVLLYACASMAYSAGLKRLPLVDLFLLAAIYSIRLFAGGIVSGHYVSTWLFSFSCFLFFSLAVIKRVSELLLLHDRAAVNSSRGYRSSDVLLLEIMGVASSFVSCVVLALYIQSPTVIHNYRSPEALWGVAILMLFWQCRLWLTTMRGNMHDDPIVFAGRDRVSWAVVLLIVLVMGLANTGIAGVFHR